MLYLMHRLCIVTWKVGLLFVFVSYQQLEIPLYVKPVSGMSKPCLQSLVQIPDILCQEEDELYHNGKEACGSDIAAAIHNGSGGYSSLSVSLHCCVLHTYITHPVSKKMPDIWQRIFIIFLKTYIH